MLMGVPAHKDVTVQLALDRCQSFHVAPWDHLMPVDNTDLKVVDLDDFGLREAWHFITVATDDMCLTFRGS